MPNRLGISRGITPTKDIPCTGAAGKRNLHPNHLKEIERGCPFWSDSEVPFAPRQSGMSLDTVQPTDVPQGPIRFTKDYDRSLLTHDLVRARPTLAHPMSQVGVPLPWRNIERRPEDKPTIELNTAKTHYPEIGDSRPRDLSLTVGDIDFAQPKSIGSNCEGRRRHNHAVDPVRPMYTFTSSEAPEPVMQRASGRCTLDVSDIEHSAPRMLIPYRTQYRDPLKCEDEFRSEFHRQLAGGVGSSDTVPSASSHKADKTQAVRLPHPSQRCTNPLEPRYIVPLTDSKGCTSLHARWAEERRVAGNEPPPVRSEEVGRVDGATPRSRIHDNGEPQLSLETGDLDRGTCMRRVGVIPFSIYGPPGNRPLEHTKLNVTDIEGAKAGTHTKGPKPTHRRNTRLGVAASLGSSDNANVPMTTAQDIGWYGKPSQETSEKSGESKGAFGETLGAKTPQSARETLIVEKRRMIGEFPTERGSVTARDPFAGFRRET